MSVQVYKFGTPGSRDEVDRLGSHRPESRAVTGRNAGNVQISIGGGCISSSASNTGDPLGQDGLVTLAKAAACRIG